MSEISQINHTDEIKSVYGEESQYKVASSNESVISFPASLNPIVNPYSVPLLDPHSPEFSLKAWTKQLLKIQKSDSEKYPTLELGVSFRNLGAYGFQGGSEYQKTVLTTLFDVKKLIPSFLRKNRTSNKTQILSGFDGLVKSGETCVVLGRPGAGCSTFLKSIACDTYGFYIDPSTQINYQGLSKKTIENHYYGEVIYNGEDEVHYPHLSVGDTLKFAAHARAPENRPEGISRDEYANHMRDAVMASMGLLHTMNTRVGNDYVRGVSGGERKRVSICEVILGGALLQCFDNSTRGLDSASALKFIQNAKVGAEISGSTVFISLYQASQDAYDLFDKVTVLYLGRQIYFGRADKAKQFFENMGYVCVDRQTTADFLTSLTSPAERVVKPGYEDIVPRTPEEFESYWKSSPEYAALIQEIEEWNAAHPLQDETKLELSQKYKSSLQSGHARAKSPYILSFWRQVGLCVSRGLKRQRVDYGMPLASIFGNLIVSLIISSIFYNLPPDTSSFAHRSSAVFFAILFNALASILEIFALYVLRPVVEKHNKYGYYHPSAEAVASIIVEFPVKIITSLSFNLVLYFMVNLRRTVGGFFIFQLFSLFAVLTMSALFRTIAALTKSIPQSLAPASYLIFAIIATTGFVIPIADMHPWIRWINYINPVAYAFEALMINEYRNRFFECNQFVPSGGPYDALDNAYKTCSVVGARPGELYVNGSDFIMESYRYNPSNLWRNLGILIAFCIFFHITYIACVEVVRGKRSKGEVLVFPRSYKKLSASKENSQDKDIEKKTENGIEAQRGIFQWEDVCYDIKIKGEPRRILDHVDGWVKPGTLTALMGASGAGKTTLLDALADRITMGVVTGNVLVNGRQRDTSFQRKTGYAQQQDVHLPTSTVREALEFSALLRQPDTYTKEEKLAYVDEVIKILEMEKYSDAVVGVPGEGLNVEQRKRLTIGVELAARPELLLFLDEPTSGLDSQTAWSIMMLMKKLTNNGQAILCTIHQPSAVLFQQFDRLLLLQKGGKTVYYGDLGENAKKMISYFERNGAPQCPPDANPAEWMLTITNSELAEEWHQIWKNSPEYRQTKNDLKAMASQSLIEFPESDENPDLKKNYAVSSLRQIPIVTKRAFLNFWRDPLYIWSKLLLTVGLSFFIGIAFWKAENTIQGLNNQLYAIFMIIVIFISFVEQMMVPFVEQRTIYETRERPSKTYSWGTFLTSMYAAELFWGVFTAVLSFFCFYYPVGLYRNAEPTDAVSERGALFFLFYLIFYIFSVTFSYMVIAAIPNADTGGNISNTIFNVCVAMCGIFATKDEMPGFWIFMYYLSPFTYIASGFLSTGIASSEVICSANEILHFPQLPESNMTCQQYLDPYSSATGGRILNPGATSNCEYCPMNNTDIYLDRVNAPYSHAWRNFGIVVGYTVFNLAMTYLLYWIFRVPKKFNKKSPKKE